MDNIYLTGMMGCGKTEVGRALARATNKTFVDIDSEIEARQKKSISALFDEFGQGHFRALESAMLLETAALSGAVVSCGGGIVLDSGNVRLMKETGVVVYIYCDPAVIVQRIGTQGRPLLAGGLHRIEEIFEQRRTLYEQAADITVLSSGTAAQVAEEILQKLSSFLKS